MRVVIVDDEWFGLDITYRLLTQIRMDLEVVAFFQDPLEALEKIPALQPDLVILDIEMPYLNGFELYERLKEMKSHFLMVTAHGASYLQLGPWDSRVMIMNKPFCKADMSAILLSMQV